MRAVVVGVIAMVLLVGCNRPPVPKTGDPGAQPPVGAAPEATEQK